MNARIRVALRRRVRFYFQNRHEHPVMRTRTYDAIKRLREYEAKFKIS